MKQWTLRAGILLCVGLALADLQPIPIGDPPPPRLILDVSASMGPAAQEHPDDIKYGYPVTYVASRAADMRLGQAPPQVGTGATRLGEAIRRAPEGTTLILVSDGLDTDGDAIMASRDHHQKGGRVFTHPPKSSVADVGLTSLRVISERPRATFEAELHATTSGEARLTLQREDRIALERTLSFVAGETRTVELVDTVPVARDAPRARYRVRLTVGAETPNDIAENDELNVVLQAGTRRALWWGDPNLDRDALAQRSDVAIQVVDVLRAAEVRAADVLVVSNIPYYEIRGHTDVIESFVARGGSLLMLGGPDAYAGGGWGGTHLEERLSALQSKRSDRTALALVLALDHSGSMAGGALQRLRESVRTAVAGLAPDERLAVLPFSSGRDATLLTPGFVSRDDTAAVETLLHALDGLEARGSTQLLRAIQASAAHLRDVDARERRVVLLSDGDPDHELSESELEATRKILVEEQIGFGALVVGMKRVADRLVTLSSNPKDVVLLRQPGAFPDSLRRQLQRRRRSKERVNPPITLVIDDATRCPIDAKLTIHFAHRLSVHPQAIRIARLTAGRGRELLPFAAERRVGAGTVVSVAWGPEGERSIDHARATDALLPLVVRLAARSDRGLAAEINGNELMVVAPFAASLGVLSLLDGEERPVGELIEREPGMFVGPIPLADGLSIRHGDARHTLRLPARPAPEFRRIGTDEISLMRIADAGGGRLLQRGQSPPRAETFRGSSWAPWFLLAALLLFVWERHESNTAKRMALGDALAG